MTFLSIIIPVYNVDINYLDECLDSCPSDDKIQTLVIDDGSTIDYTNVIKKYNVDYIRIENSGVAAARNVGIDYAVGEYITFLDSDDKLENILEILEKLNGSDIILARNYILRESKGKTSCKFNDSDYVDANSLKRDMFLLSNRIFNNIEMVWCKFYKRKFLIKNNIRFNEKLKRGEDVLFNYIALSKTNNIYYLNEYCYVYRVNNNSMTRSFDYIMADNTYKLLDEFEQFFKDMNIEDPYYSDYVFRLIVRLMRKYFCYLEEKEFYQKIELLFSNTIIDNCLQKINTDNLDKYKMRLYELLLKKNKYDLYNYIREVCDKKLLKK